MNQAAQDIDSLSLAPELLMIVERYAVYRCYSDSGELLYIGITGTVGRRLGDHLQKAWFTQVRGMTFEWYADELDARNAERRAIHIEHPKYNVVHRNSTHLRPAAAPQRRKRAKGRQQASACTPAEARKLAFAVLAAEPDITGAALGERCGMGERWGQMRKADYAEYAALGANGEE